MVYIYIYILVDCRSKSYFIEGISELGHLVDSILLAEKELNINMVFLSCFSYFTFEAICTY